MSTPSSANHGQFWHRDWVGGVLNVVAVRTLHMATDDESMGNVKPTNIMDEADSDTVKVSDFGTLRITDSSYSLGVMLFQMLKGPFRFAATPWPN